MPDADLRVGETEALPRTMTLRSGDRVQLVLLRQRHLLGQLVPARVAVALVLLTIDPPGLARISVTIDSFPRFLSRDAFARILVPSTEISPTRTSPASPHSPSNDTNNSPIAVSSRRRNSAIAE